VRPVSGTGTSVAAEAPPVRPSVNLGVAFDVIMVAVLGGVAWVARWGSLPSDGLWFDDSWVAAGAILGPGDLLTVGSSHPGFTGILMVVDRLGGGDLTYLGVPSLVFGAVTPPALYLGLRAFGYERAISALVGYAPCTWIPASGASASSQLNQRRRKRSWHGRPMPTACWSCRTGRCNEAEV
jgi:hypothetical protein